MNAVPQDSQAGPEDGNASSMRWEDLPQPLVFFDGVCGICNHTVDFLLQKDRDAVLRFSPLQGRAFALVLERHPELAGQDSIILLQDQVLSLRSDAILAILKHLPGWPSWAGKLLGLLPRPLRDFGYRHFAALRYRIFGKRESCRIPSPAERARFVD